MKKNQKRLTTLLVAILFLLLLFVIKFQPPEFLSKKPNQPFSALNKEKINELLITKDKATSLVKINKIWQVKKDGQQYRADAEKINKIIDAVINLKKDEIVSANKNKHPELGINKQKIEVKADGKSYLLYIGNTSGQEDNYVRIDNENVVFLSGGFTDAFTSDDYRDLQVHIINDETKVTAIEINFDDKKTALSKTGSDWKIGKNTAKKDRVDFFLNDLKTLKAKDILIKQQNYPEINPELSISVKENNKEKNIEFYPQNEEEYLSRTFPSEYDYLVASAYVASLKKEEKDFLE